MLHRGLITEQFPVFEKPQVIIGQCGTTHHQAVYLELARRQTFQIYIGFEFAMKQLAGAIALIEGESVISWGFQGCPPDDIDCNPTGSGLFFCRNIPQVP